MAANNDLESPVNIGNPAEITVGQLAETVIDLTGSKSEIINLPLPIDDPKRRKPDISLAESVLNWTPKVGLATGLGQTIAYFSEKMR